MRCSKCQYIGFDSSDRCRNCGYEFSLAVEAELDLPIRTGDEPSGPLSDFALTDPDAPEPTPPPASSRPPAQPASREPSSRTPRTGRSGELPLFLDRTRDEDAPLVTLPASPRAPVAVRKSTLAPRPVQPPISQEPEPELDLDLSDDDEEAPAEHADPERHLQAPAAGAAVAPIGRRLLAALVDVALLAAIDLVVLYFTLKLCGLGMGDALLIPLVPFAAFIVLLNGGYVAAFTAAGGQTIGKMLTGIKVVTSEEDAWTDRVPMGAAALRAVGYLISALPAGLGFLPVLAGGERRALHDRLAHTRVVKA